MVQWLAPVAPDPPPDGAPAAGLTDDEIFAQRGDHALWFHPTDEALWQEHLPYIAWQHRSAGGALRQGVVAGEIARVVLPFVVLDEGAADRSRSSRGNLLRRLGRGGWTRSLGRKSSHIQLA